MSELVKLAKEALRQQKALSPMSCVHSAARVTWEGADLTLRHGVVEFLHTDADGSQWAFCTTADGWAAVNVIFLRRKEN